MLYLLSNARIELCLRRSAGIGVGSDAVVVHDQFCDSEYRMW